MFSKVLLKLVDQAIIPAVLLLAVRVVSVVLLGKFFGVPISIDNTGFVFNSSEEFILVNSYSIVIMLASLALGVSYVVLKSFVFHDSHIDPFMTARLFSLRLSSFIQTSYDIYSQGIVWVSYLYLMLFVSALLAMFGLVYSWVFPVSLVLVILSTVLFVFDIEHELSLARTPFGGTDPEDDLESSQTVVRFEEGYGSQIF